MLQERENRVKRDIKPAYCVGKLDVTAFQLDGLRKSLN